MDIFLSQKDWHRNFIKKPKRLKREFYMNINKLKTYLFSMLLFCPLFFVNVQGNIIRATVDIGSGATKLRVAEVDLKNHKIVNILESKVFAVPYQEDLANSPNGNFSRDVMDQGIKALEESKELAQKHHAEKVIAVATAAFRKAHNASDFISEIKEKTGIDVNIIDQQLEGELAFQAVSSQFGLNPKNLIVWDIGGGSFQLTAVDENGEFEIYRGHEASVPFKNYVIQKIQKQDISKVSTPNPLNFEQLLKAQGHALGLAQKVDEFFVEKIRDPSTEIVGVGNILGVQIAKMVNGDFLTKDRMITEVANLANKNDKDVGGGNFANVFVTNTILVLGFMEGLNIDKLKLADINPADGAFFYDSFWKVGQSNPPVEYAKQYNAPHNASSYEYSPAPRYNYSPTPRYNYSPNYCGCQ